jgi:membrane protein
MARLTDVPVALRKIGPFRFALRIWNQVSEDNVFVWAAALAYSWLFALFPFFVVLLTLIPYIPQNQKQHVMHGLDQAMRQLPDETYQLINERVTTFVTRTLTESHGGLMSMGIVLALWAASGGTAMTMSALDRCYDIDINRPFYQQRPIAILLTVVVAVLLVTILLLLPIGTAILDLLWRYAHLPGFLYHVLTAARWALALVLMVVLLNIVYHFGTQVKQTFRFITPGAVFVIVVWVVLGTAFRMYINHAAPKYNLTYGAVGGVVILLLLFYIDALVLLIGAEINSEIDFAVLGIPNGTLDFRAKPPVSVADSTMPTP